MAAQKIPRTLKDTLPPEYRAKTKAREQEPNAKGVLVYRLTDAEQALFWRALAFWQLKLGLQGWRITQKTVDAGAFMAEMAKWDKKQLQVRCTLNTDWGNSEPTPLEIERAAVHELLHVVVEPLSSLIEERLHDSDLKLAAEHSAINRIEALLVPAPTEGL